MGTSLTLEQMKAFVRNHFEDFVNNRKASVIHQNMTADFYDHDGPGGKPTDAAGDEAMMLRMYSIMPGLKITIEEMVADGDKVVCRNVWNWSDAGTGKPMEFHGFVEWRFEGDKIAERWATVTAPAEVHDGG
jgi:predicted ester cyclase